MKLRTRIMAVLSISLVQPFQTRFKQRISLMMRKIIGNECFLIWTIPVFKIFQKISCGVRAYRLGIIRSHFPHYETNIFVILEEMDEKLYSGLARQDNSFAHN